MDGMKMKEKVTLESLGSLEESQREGIQDILGYKVVNPAGDEIGSVEDVFIDPRHKHMAMVLVKMGGVLGIGAHRILAPFDQIVVLEENRIHVKTKDEVETEIYTGVGV